jgi:penicillin-insensitive murein DD-endopeptidase
MQTGAAELPRQGLGDGNANSAGYFWLRGNDRHYGLPRFVQAIVRAAKTVNTQRPGSMLGIGDLSTKDGGALMPHWSHRTGRDADLIFYMQALDGTPVPNPDFVIVGADGLGWDKKGARFLRFDVEREWLLVRTLVLDEDARIQWIFCHRSISALLLEWARARGESTEVLYRAATLLHEPGGAAGAHDDHLHIRTECSADEASGGCITGIPHRPWLPKIPEPTMPSIDQAVLDLFVPLNPASTRAMPVASSTSERGPS